MRSKGEIKGEVGRALKLRDESTLGDPTAFAAVAAPAGIDGSHWAGGGTGLSPHPNLDIPASLALGVPIVDANDE